MVNVGGQAGALHPPASRQVHRLPKAGEHVDEGVVHLGIGPAPRPGRASAPSAATFRAMIWARLMNQLVVATGAVSYDSVMAPTRRASSM